MKSGREVFIADIEHAMSVRFYEAEEAKRRHERLLEAMRVVRVSGWEVFQVACPVHRGEMLVQAECWSSTPRPPVPLETTLESIFANAWNRVAACRHCGVPAEAVLL